MLHLGKKRVTGEPANSMNVVESHHAPICHDFRIIFAEAPDLKKDEAHQMAVKAMKDSVDPNGLVPTVLVFSALPRLGFPTNGHTPSTFKRAIALRKETVAMS